MTFLDFLRILRAQLVLIILLPLLSMFVCYRVAESRMTTSYTATASVVTNISMSVATGFANTAASAASTDDTTVRVTATTSSATLTFTATGPKEQESVDAANTAATNAQQRILTVYTTSATSVVKAESATAVSQNPRRYAIIGLCAGLALAIVIALIWDMVARRIHAWDSVEQKGVKYLGSFGGSESRQEKLAVTVSLATHKNGLGAGTVYLVPVGRTQCAPAVARQLTETAKSHPEALVRSQSDSTVPVFPRIVVDANLIKSEDATHDEENPSCSMLVIEQEKSSYKDLGNTLRDFSVAGLSPVGFIFVGKWAGFKARRSSAQTDGQADAAPASSAAGKTKKADAAKD